MYTPGSFVDSGHEQKKEDQGFSPWKILATGREIAIVGDCFWEPQANDNVVNLGNVHIKVLKT